MTLRDYFSGNEIFSSELIENYDSVLLSMPHEKIYDKPVAIYNNISYNSKNIENLMEMADKPYKKLTILRELQEMSIENPLVNTIIICSEQFNTPICYDFNNNFNSRPERYYPKNNTQHPLDDIHNNGTFEGINGKGDRIVPINVISKLKNMWGSNCTVEIIKDKDHFTILKSYELALIISASLK